MLAGLAQRCRRWGAGITGLLMAAPCGYGAPADAAVRVLNPQTLPDRISADRIAVGVPDDYKPNLAKLPDGTVLLLFFHPLQHKDGSYTEPMILYASRDGGRTWGARRTLPLLGREPYFSMLKDGTLFISTHLLANDARNPDGYIHSYLHRSTDGGATWETVRFGAEDVPGTAPKTWTHTTRNVLELQDGTMVFGVSAGSSTDVLLRSRDKGRSWEAPAPCRVEGFDVNAQGFPWHAETMLWQAPNGDLLGIARCLSGALPPLTEAAIPLQGSDHFERIALFRSRDGGRTWTLEPELGNYYGEHYQAVLRLQDGRLLFTFTVRALRPPLGVHAVLGAETADGFAFDFRSDRLVLAARTPVGKPSGGGFGNTVQLRDGTLLTAYSYRGADDRTRVEVVRWQLPAAAK